MELLYFFEKIRNPVFDFFFSVVTHLGDETAFLVIGIILFWCVNKKTGYYMLISGFFGTIVNQVMKLACKIPRPWVKDPKFTIVESAREAATGYSFPSGHTSNAFSTFGSIFITSKNKGIKIACAILACLVAISRMYLGVHTPWDVLAGICCPVIILLLLEGFFKDDKVFHKAMPFIVGALTLMSIAFFLYAAVFTEQTSEANVISAAKNARTMLGCSLGLILVYVLDRFVIKFETKSTWYGQIFKLVFGFAVILLIKSVLKSPLEALMGDSERILRYFLMIAFGGAVWPLTFKYVSKVRISVLDRFGEKVKSLFCGQKKSDKVE